MSHLGPKESMFTDSLAPVAVIPAVAPSSHYHVVALCEEVEELEAMALLMTPESNGSGHPCLPV